MERTKEGYILLEDDTLPGSYTILEGEKYFAKISTLAYASIEYITSHLARTLDNEAILYYIATGIHHGEIKYYSVSKDFSKHKKLLSAATIIRNKNLPESARTLSGIEKLIKNEIKRSESDIERFRRMILMDTFLLNNDRNARNILFRYGSNKKASSIVPIFDLDSCLDSPYLNNILDFIFEGKAKLNQCITKDDLLEILKNYKSHKEVRTALGNPEEGIPDSNYDYKEVPNYLLEIDKLNGNHMYYYLINEYCDILNTEATIKYLEETYPVIFKQEFKKLVCFLIESRRYAIYEHAKTRRKTL